jgi:hypothetical protein
VKGELELIAHADHVQTERARWASRLAPKTPTCCNQACRQGRKCPARTCALITANSDGTSAGHAIDELLDDTGLLLGQGIALLVFVVSAVMYASLWL